MLVHSRYIPRNLQSLSLAHHADCTPPLKPHASMHDVACDCMMDSYGVHRSPPTPSPSPCAWHTAALPPPLQPGTGRKVFPGCSECVIVFQQSSGAAGLGWDDLICYPLAYSRYSLAYSHLSFVQGPRAPPLSMVRLWIDRGAWGAWVAWRGHVPLPVYNIPVINGMPY